MLINSKINRGDLFRAQFTQGVRDDVQCSFEMANHDRLKLLAWNDDGFPVIGFTSALDQVAVGNCFSDTFFARSIGAGLHVLARTANG